MSRTLKGCCALIGFAAIAGIAIAETPVHQGRISISEFSRVPGVVETEYPQAATAEKTLACVWDNGPVDNLNPHLAQSTSIGFFQAADDFIVKAGFYMYIDTIDVCFLVSDTIDGIKDMPVCALNIYGDCNGRPNDADLFFSTSDTLGMVNGGPSAAYPGFNKWTFTYEVKAFIAGYTRLWISPYGIGDIQDGLYYWCSVNFGQIQGAMGQLKDGAEPWQDTLVCDCPGVCTDFCFKITGHRCCLAKNNVPHSTTEGAKSLQRHGALIDTERSVDNFQITPNNRVELCRVEAWMATNCPLDKVYFEIYENVCNMPGAKLHTYDVVDYPEATDTGVDAVFNGMSLNIYHFCWPVISGITLDPGRDYWISIVARGTSSINSKAYWMYLATGACNINITEGKVKDPFTEGLEDFTFVSEAFAGAPRDFAFQLYVNEIGAKAENDPSANDPAPTPGGGSNVGGADAPFSFNGRLTGANR